MPVKVSEKTIRRLSHYARCLRMALIRGETIITSQQMASNCGISSAAVRRDLATYGEFGKQGSGYAARELLANIELILGTTDPPGVIIAGAGNIGCALLQSGLEGTGGYTYRGIFDIDCEKIGKTCSGMTIRDVSEIREMAAVDHELIAIIAVSPGQGQIALNTLVKSGVRAFLSFNLEPLGTPPGVELSYVEVSTELDVLTHAIRKRGVNR
jgi:redox-sensing transcriptional repressor